MVYSSSLFSVQTRGCRWDPVRSASSCVWNVKLCSLFLLLGIPRFAFVFYAAALSKIRLCELGILARDCRRCLARRCRRPLAVSFGFRSAFNSIRVLHRMKQLGFTFDADFFGSVKCVAEFTFKLVAAGVI